MAHNPYINAPLKRAQIDASADVSDITVVAAVSGKSIIVVHYLASVSAAGNITFKSGSTEIWGPLYMPANAGESDQDVRGLFKTAAGEALNLARSASMAVGGGVMYHEV